MRFLIVRLGKDSVLDIKALDAIHESPKEPLVVQVECKQVPEEASVGDYAFICLGSDNNKGVPIEWIRGVRAFGKVLEKSGGPSYNDTWFVKVEIKVVLSESVTQRDLLGMAPNAYFWCSDIPVLGVDTHANQTIQLIRTEEDHQKVEAFVYAINAIRPSFKSDVVKKYRELEKIFDYSPPSPLGESGAFLSSLKPVVLRDGFIGLPKPFLLLAGISGTGKSRFVRLQAEDNAGCYELVPVRPDWHEPSDLLGYVSRINSDRYVVTPFVKFLVKAWKNAFSAFENGVLSINQDLKTYWLCLDEMNLAPVEQYFADYLSVLETREWKNGVYTTEPLIRPAILEEDVRRTLREGLDLVEDDPLWLFFMEKGIQLAPNLVVAGTVNMDETTHGFSRKVIDRAYTIDFGDFFPNRFDQFFEPQTRPKKLGYSCYTSVDRSEPMSMADPHGTKSIRFLTEVNEIFIDTPFQLAFRALNELLVTIKCFAPTDELQMKAVWDDFLMAKLLPRVEGDLQKIGKDDSSVLNKLAKVLELNGFDGIRPDLLSETVSGGVVDTEFRSPRKLSWMQKRLDDNGFTSFWP